MARQGRAGISGMTLEEYSAWMKDTCGEVLMKNSSEPIDKIIERMRGEEASFSVFEESDFAETTK